MKNLNYIRLKLEVTDLHKLRTLVSFLIPLIIITMLVSCEDYEDNMITLAGKLSLSSSEAEIILNEKDNDNAAISFHWTTGNNGGTGSSISYRFEIDDKGDNFSSKTISFDLGKTIYSKSFSVRELNESLLNHWSFTPGEESILESRVVATIHSESPYEEISNVILTNVVPYEPVSTVLFMVGDATSGGWDFNNATEMTPSADISGEFVFKGSFSVGNFSFITTIGQELPAYGQGEDLTQLAFETEDASLIKTFPISEEGAYRIKVNLLNKTISIAKWEEPAYSQIFIVGSASPAGWDYSNAIELIQDGENPFIFTYSGVLNKGEFKFPVNRDTDGNQDMYMRTDDTHIYLHNGGDADDNNWMNEKKGYYTLSLDLKNMTLTKEQTKLYIVGSATPVQWDIENAIEMVEDEIDGCIFTYTGPLTEGEFKFPVNRNSDWAQDMYMRIDDSHMYLHHGGDEDDNKWVITDAGNYVITANIELLTVDIVKQ